MESCRSQRSLETFSIELKYSIILGLSGTFSRARNPLHRSNKKEIFQESAIFFRCRGKHALSELQFRCKFVGGWDLLLIAFTPRVSPVDNWLVVTILEARGTEVESV